MRGFDSHTLSASLPLTFRSAARQRRSADPVLRTKKKRGECRVSSGQDLEHRAGVEPAMRALQARALATWPPVPLKSRERVLRLRSVSNSQLRRLACGYWNQLFLAEIPVGNFQSGAVRCDALFGICLRDRSRDYHGISWPPVCRHRTGVLVGGLQRFEDAQQLIDVASQIERVVQQRTNVVLRIDEKHGSYSRGVAHCLVDHAKTLRDLLI